jgi:hypothetical protein
MHRLVFALAIAIATAPGARAAHPLITEDTGTQGKGRWQLEANAESGRDHEVAGVNARSFQPAATLSHGFAENADLQLTLYWLREKRAGLVVNGALDTAVDVKWRFFEKDALSLGLKPGVTLPTGDEQKGLGAGRTGWGTLFILSYEPGPLAFHAHAATSATATRRANAVRSHLSGALTYKIMEQLKVVVDVARDTDPDPAGSLLLHYAVLGAIWSVTPDFDLDIGLKTGDKGAALDRALLLGASWRW